MNIPLKSMFLTVVIHAWLFSCPLFINAELIEPTRTLQGPKTAVGLLTVFSEPPGLDIALDDNVIGKTPSSLKEIEAGIHVLRVDDSETKVYIEPGGTLRVSLHKGEFINIPIAEKKLLRLEPPKNKGATDIRTGQQPPAGEQEKKAFTDLLWFQTGRPFWIFSQP